jgi:hypothetical protein
MGKQYSVVVLIALLAVGSVGCGNAAPETTSTVQPTPATPQTSPLVGFEKHLQFIKDGQYTYIWVLSRKDGKPFDASDKDFLNKNAPQIVDRVATDDKLKIIVGTNFDFEEGNMALLKKRYVMENYSGR